MGPPVTDDDADYQVDYRTTVRTVWTPHYLRKFTKLLSANTVVLQSANAFPRCDPIHALRRAALEHMRAELGLGTRDAVRARLVSFKKFAASKLRQQAERCGRDAGPDAILKAAPRWLRALEPHLSLWAGGPAADGAALAAGLARSARAARSLEARAVCRRVPAGAPRDDLYYVWWRMLDVGRQKLALLRDAGARAGVRLCGAEHQLADSLLLFDDTICTVSESADHDSAQSLVALFLLVQRHRLEDADVTAGRWLRALADHRAGSSAWSSALLLQRRWHELKAGARRAFLAYARSAPAPPAPRALHTAVVRRYPHVVTSPARSWRDLVDAGAVFECEESAPEERDAAPPPPEDDPEDLIVVERAIETIDLIAAEEEAEQAGGRRASLASTLEAELERELRQLSAEGAAGDCDMSLPEPLFIYEDEGEGEGEDRSREQQQDAPRLKQESGRCSPAAAGDSSSDTTEDDAHEDNDENFNIDEKLLMDARVDLFKIDSLPAWRRHANLRRRSIRLAHLPPACLPPACLPPAQVRVKLERIDEETSPGERTVKSMAKRLISEMLRDDAAGDDARVTKKVQLPDIAEVRKNNQSLLTAQVAPLSSGAGASLSRRELDEALQQLARAASADADAGGGGGGARPPFCCQLRRMHAVNAARARHYLRAGRAPPAPLQLHAGSACGRRGACTCCCRGLLGAEAGHAAAGAALLLQEERTVRAELDRLAAAATEGGSRDDPDGEAPPRLTDADGPPPKRTKKSDKRGDPPEPPAADPLQEWIRQRTLNQKYFNLNLKTRPQQSQQANQPPKPKPVPKQDAPPLELRKFLVMPADGDPDVETKVIYTHNQSKAGPAPLPAPLSAPLPARLADSARVKAPPTISYQKILSKPSAEPKRAQPEPAPPALAAGKVSVPFSSAKIIFSTSRALDTCGNTTTAAPRPLQRGHLVRLSPAPAPPSRVTARSSPPPLVPSGALKPRTSTSIRIIRPPTTTHDGKTLQMTSSIVKLSSKDKGPPGLTSLTPSAGPRAAPAPAPGELRGTGLKIIKISSESRTLLIDALRASPRPRPEPAPGPSAAPDACPEPAPGQRLINTQDAARAASFSAPLLSGGAVLTKMRVGRKTSSAVIAFAGTKRNKRPAPAPSTAPAPAPEAPPPWDIEQHFKRTDVDVSLETFLQSQDPSNIVLQRMDARAPLFVLLDTYYVLTESELTMRESTYWPLGTPQPPRIIMESGTAEQPASRADGKLYLQLRAEPALHARVLSGARSAQEVRAELARGAVLHAVHARSGALHALGSAAPGPARSARADTNARADLLMMLNNVKREPIEMVYVDSDDEHKSNDFKGLEKFEELDEFEL